MKYLYRPEGNNTPVNDPVLGHLSYEGVYEGDDYAKDPRFVKATEKDLKKLEQQTPPEPEAPQEETPAAGGDPAPEASQEADENASHKRTHANGGS